ncbi:AraC family transcriptional regulator [Oceanobacillus halophilus]|uniref:AraC family transcriptional regulator n=2 Tax=Oceanobacillus halophilus TaxID=930130 RepID=A0A494ZZB4_9BACI|nr:AraC family transcriptional regulator [Oceanobacillus halophilus]
MKRFLIEGDTMDYKQANILTAAMKLYNLTNLNTYVLDQNGDFIYLNEKVTTPPFMPGTDERDTLYLFQEISKTNKIYSYLNEWNLHYLGLSFETEEKYTIIIGPFLEATPDIYALTRKYKLLNNEIEDLRIFLNQLDVLSIDKINTFASLLNQFELLLQKEPDFEIINPRNNKNEMDTKNPYNVSEEEDVIKMRYKIEEKLIHAVEAGDKRKAKELHISNNMLFSFSDRFPNQPLRRVKNLAIVLNTLLRTAARNSKVPAILIHRISEKYVYEIEYTSQLAKLYHLYDEMIDSYSDVVMSNALRKYSKVVQQVIEYLINFYDQQIDKEELSTLTFTHPSHLSRKFKQETGLTITGYQQTLRINQAKYLLRSENLPIEEIAWLVGYDDSSYFTRVFKKETGSTPTQYREEN